ncbi:MAG: insulinase family protein [Candidatus Omnitrophica bacterium]|nr:insulinase family protein [Candidatus Omnitrophota bacterium]
MYKKETMANGLRIVSHQMPSRQSLALGIWIAVGGRYETAANKGISHFLEHMLFKGTARYSCRKIKESIEGIGGSINGFTSEEATCFLVKIPAGYLKVALEILSDMVLEPALKQADIDKERTVILEEIKMYRDLPQSYVYELLDRLLWPNHPLGMPVIGTVESVGKIDRDSLSIFRRNYYTPSNIVISLAGAFDYQKFRNYVARIFGKENAKEKSTFQNVVQNQEGPGLDILPKDTEQTHLALGFHSLPREHPLKYALSMLHIILGANMSSRLFHELRENHGLAYEIGSALKRYQETGAFLVHAGIDNHKVIPAIKLILKELKKTTEKLVSYDEFKRAKDFYAGQLMLTLEDTLEHMLWIGESTTTLNKTYSLHDVIAQINKVDKEQIRNTARMIFREDKLNVALIGPLNSREKDIAKVLRFA